MASRNSALFVVLALLLTGSVAGSVAGAEETVKVFILAGQSNMEGKAPNDLLNHQATDQNTRAMFAHLRDGDDWIVRDDVFIRYGNRHGGLTIGYGFPNRTGVELEFGHVLGDHEEQPILLIKTAWGGHSLVKLFRSPSAGLPAQEQLQAELEQAQQRVRNDNEKKGKSAPLPTMEQIQEGYGSSYRKMMDEVHDTLARCDELFPALAGKRREIAGFVWFQGWNDQYGGAEKEYASNMEHFIRDVRKDLGAPRMPFVIGVMGQNGSKPAKGAMAAIQEAQIAMEQVADFRGNVRALKTDVLVDEAAEKLYPEWRERFEEWKLTGGDHAYHYLGSAIWFNRIGREMGKAMIELREKAGE